MHSIIHIGVDPATQLLGLCLVDTNGNPLPPTTFDRSWRLFTAKGDVFDRLEFLEQSILAYLTTELPVFLDAACGPHGWTIGSITVENPASGNKGYQNDGKSRHDTTLALGGAFFMVMRCARAYQKDHPSVQLFQSKASEASSELKLPSRVSKLQRNHRCAELNNGRFHVNDESKPEKGYVIGGFLDGAGPDPLDAYGAAQVGRSKYIASKLMEAARGSNVRRSKQSRVDRTHRGTGRSPTSFTNGGATNRSSAQIQPRKRKGLGSSS